MAGNLTPLEHLVQHAVLYLQNNGYSDSSVKRYHKCWKTLLQVCQRECIRYFCYEQCLPLMLMEWQIDPHAPVSPFQRFQIRSLKGLRDFQDHGKFFKCYRDKRQPSALFDSEMLQKYENHLREEGLKESTILSRKYAVSHFLKYQSEQEAGLSDQFVIKYLDHLQNSPFSPATKGLYLSSIKKYLEFLFFRQEISVPLHRLFSGNSFSKYVRLPSKYSQEDLKSILSAVDRDSLLGRRDYLVLVLAMQLGIRAGDLCLLKMENIHWATDSIQFIQQKTGNEQILPMPENVKYALLHYLKNSRPQISLPYIFIRPRAPYTPYENTNPFYKLIGKYMELSGVDYSGKKHGLHAMRHSLAGNLLADGADLPVISGILGHSSTETTMRYAGIDITALRRVALEVTYER